MLKINTGIVNFEECNDSLVNFTNISDLISIGYLDTAAGSNPREFQGMTKINSNILRSFLDDRNNFWAKHLGINVTVKNGEMYRKKPLGGMVYYQDACITNGLQTISIFKILLMIKLYQLSKKRNTIHNKIVAGNEEGFKKSIYNEVGEIADEIFFNISISQVNKVYNWFHKNENVEYIKIFNKLSIEDILETKISIKIVILDKFVNENEQEYEYSLQKIGDNIALANNETQNVRIDDKFGTRQGKWLDENLLCSVSSNYVSVEYRKFSTKPGDIPSMHILDILRSIVYTSLIVDSREDICEAGMVCKYANSRTPVYSLFDKFIKCCEENDKNLKLNQVIIIVRNLMPHVLPLLFIFNQRLKIYYNNLNVERICKMSGLDSVTLMRKLRIDNNDYNDMSDEEKRTLLNKNIMKYLYFSSNNLFSIFVFVIRKAIIIDNKLQVELNLDEFQIDQIIDQIYFRLLKVKLTEHIGSISDIYRDKEIYNDISYACNCIISNQIDYIEKYRVNLINY